MSDFIQTALRIKRAIKAYYEANPSVGEIQAKELMPWFIKQGIFNENYQDGLPIRKLLRKLDEENLLNLIPYVKVEQKDINRNWYFVRA